MLLPRRPPDDFQNGDHGVETAWGFLAVRLPMPEDKQWADDRATILKRWPRRTGTDPRLEVGQAANVARLTQEDWQKQRDKTPSNQCHSGNGETATGAGRPHGSPEAGHRLMAEAIVFVRLGCTRSALPKRRAMPMPSLTC